jgi:hypothetical protein
MVNRKLAAAAAALLLPPAALGGWYFVSRSIDSNPSPWQFMRDLGYSELAPPSRLFPPGILATVEKLPNGSVQLYAACRMDLNALAPLSRVSSTVDAHFTSKANSAFAAMAKTLTVAAARATGNRVKQVDISLEDMQIVTMSSEDLIKIRGDYLKGTCQEAVIWNLRAGASVCQTAEVLRADLAYRMSFTDALNTSQQAELTEKVNTELRLGFDKSSVNEVRGDNLYFGVRVSLNCIVPNDPQVVSTS